MKVRFNISSFLLCECGSALYGQPNGEYVIAVCLSPMCEDFNVQKIVRAIEVPYTLSPTKVTLDAYASLDLGEQEAQKQREEAERLQKEHRQVKDLRMFSG
jgi:hypothetical protein